MLTRCIHACGSSSTRSSSFGGWARTCLLFTCHGASSGSTGVLPKRSMSVLSAHYLNGRAIAISCWGWKEYTFVCLCVRIIFARRSGTLNDLQARTVCHDPFGPFLELGELCLQAPQSCLLLPNNCLPALIFLDLLIQNVLSAL